MKTKPKKHCDLGNHECDNLFHSRTKYRPSCCPLHAPRTPIKSNLTKVKPEPLECYSKQRKKINDKIHAITPKEDKSIPQLLKLAQIVFNKWIRNRDSIYGGFFKCISCGKLKKIEDADCGHFMPSTYSELRFSEVNCHNECSFCNRSDENHLIGYRKNLFSKIGKEKLDWLESHKISTVHKWNKQELLDIINKYK